MLLRRTLLVLSLALGVSGVGAASAAVQPIAGPGADIGYPQCGAAYPVGAGFGFVGVNGSTFASYNPCLASELGWAATTGRTPQLYVLAANPGPGGTFWNMGGDQPCDGSDSMGCAFDYGEIGAQRALAQAAPDLTGPVFWWVDVEGGADGPTWSTDQALNKAVVAGEIAQLQKPGGLVSGVGLYTHVAPAQNQASDLVSLLGDVHSYASLPLWLATGPGDDNQAAAACRIASDTGGPIVYGQALVGGFDADVACLPTTRSKVTGALANSTRLSGYALPDTIVTLLEKDLTGKTSSTTAAVNASGAWSATVPFSRDSRVTVTSDSGQTGADLRPAIGVTLSSRLRPAGACAATLTGTTSAWWKGQQVQLKGGARTVTVTSKRTAHGGSFSGIVTGLCGRGRTITATADGKAGRQRLTEPGGSHQIHAKVS